MKRTYKIIDATISKEDKKITKYNIVYLVDGIQESVEFFGYDLSAPVGEIREGYTKASDSL